MEPKLQNQNTLNYTGWCVEAHDLAASKLVAFREKDRRFVRVMLAERLVDAEKLVACIQALPRSREEQERWIAWVRGTFRELT